MKDDALAPIIAVMLILAAIVTVLSIWNAVYVPSMKEADEVEHLKNVASSFQRFSSDLEYAVSSHQNHLSFSEPVQLGGGDVTVNPLTSSGTLRVQEISTPVYTLNLTGNPDDGPVRTFNGTLVTFSYEPVANFWQEQGYRWQYGYINVTKYKTLQSPLQYYTMNEVNSSLESGSLEAFAKSFATASFTRNQTPVKNQTPTADNQFVFAPLEGNCDTIDLYVVNLTASFGHSFASGNGYGSLRLTSTVYLQTLPEISEISFGSDTRPFGKRAINGLNTTFGAMNKTVCRNNIMYNLSSTETLKQWDIRQDVSPVNVTLHSVIIEISAD
ncbi:MAG TPA: hypothetical protein PKM50_01595 [Methanoregula sp.]|nr:hypothetical protein [Methanoregula sp.]